MIFETDRIDIRQLSLTDLDAFYAIHGDEALMAHIPAPVLTKAESKAELITITEAYKVLSLIHI